MDIVSGLKFDNNGLIPAIIQDANNDEILMLAYMNEESLGKTLETGLTHFWSRSREKLWQKGESSGNMQRVVDIYKDCDNDTLLIKVKQKGVACHTGEKTCFHKPIAKENDISTENVIETSENSIKNGDAKVLQEVYNVIAHRKDNPQPNSYTNYLFDKGLDKILKKVGEESAEVIIASKNREEDEVVYEVADLIYHLLVTLVEQDIPLNKIYKELENRR